MKLLWSSRSPFVRKVMVAAHETGLAGRIRTERVVVAANKPNADVMALNPLNKIPTLVLEEGNGLHDSRVICEYLDELHDGPKLFPSDRAARWPVLRRQALGDGLMEVNVLRLGPVDILRST
jgi:glutathione S-transferase